MTKHNPASREEATFLEIQDKLQMLERSVKSESRFTLVMRMLKGTVDAYFDEGLREKSKQAELKAAESEKRMKDFFTPDATNT